MNPTLNQDEIRRYSRHLVMPEVGREGQERLKTARVLVVGVGGLGSPVAMYLAAAGIGKLGLVEFDRVEESNLQRQVLFGQSDIGRPKIEVAQERLREINPLIEVTAHPARIDSSNAMTLLNDYDVVVDGSDNFPTRYLVNDACVLAGKPNVYGSIFRFEGQISVFWGAQGPCYRCLFPEPPPPGLVPSCAEGGVLGVLPGIIGSLQANEAIKLVLGIGESLVGRLVIFDALSLRFREMRLKKSAECPVCSAQPTVTELASTTRRFAVWIRRSRRRMRSTSPSLDSNVSRSRAGVPCSSMCARRESGRSVVWTGRSCCRCMSSPVVGRSSMGNRRSSSIVTMVIDRHGPWIFFAAPG